MTTNRQIFEARVALARIANAELPLPVLALAVPLLDACEAVIEKAAGMEGEDFARYMDGARELPECVLPMIPEIRMSYVEYKALDGLVKFEEVG